MTGGGWWARRYAGAVLLSWVVVSVCAVPDWIRFGAIVLVVGLLEGVKYNKGGA